MVSIATRTASGEIIPANKLSISKLTEARAAAIVALTGVGNMSEFHEEADGRIYAYRRPATFAEEAAIAGLRTQRANA